MIKTTVDGSIRYDTKYHGIELSEHIQRFYLIECDVNNWILDKIDDNQYGYNMYAHILKSFFENGDRINTKKLHEAWANNYLFWISKKPWEHNDEIMEYKGETEEKTSIAYDSDIPDNKKKNLILSLQKFRNK